MATLHCLRFIHCLPNIIFVKNGDNLRENICFQGLPENGGILGQRDTLRKCIKKIVDILQ